MKIAMLDLNHMTCGVHTNTCPLSIGLIQKYTTDHVKGDLDFRMFKEIGKLQEALKTWVPDVLGLAQYSWNSELNLFGAGLAKKINPKAIIILGGPNLDLTAQAKLGFLRAHPDVDLCIEFDGEVPFASIVQSLIDGKSISQVKIDPPAGVYALHPKTKELSDKHEKPPRLMSLDEFGSVYADGLFDEFLDAGYHPFVQTHRGCPYGCTFCHTSNEYYNKMMFQTPEVFRRDMEYLGKRLAGRHDVVLYIANTNMSMFKEDIEIAKVIRATQEKYDWPKFFNVNSGKIPHKLIEILKIMKFRPGIALQTLTPEVLRNTHRINIPIEKYKAFQEEVLKQTGESSATELILCLEGETRETFMTTLRTVVNSGVQHIVIYTLMNLRGTPIATPEYAAHNKHLIRHRIVPRQFSEIDGQKVFDTEEVIVATKTMSFEDYLFLRGVSFTISTIFGNSELVPLKRFLLDHGVDMAQWVFNIHEKMSKYKALYRHYAEFMQETKDELFPTREDLIAYYSEPTHYQELLEGKRGDNLIRKYKSDAQSQDYPELLHVAVDEARALLGDKMDPRTAESVLKDLTTYLLTRDMRPLLTSSTRPKDHTITLKHDVPTWLSDDGKDACLEELEGTYIYNVAYHEKIMETLTHFLGANKDPSLSLAILYRDGYIHEFWPAWHVVSAKTIEKKITG
ncbi:MAG: radical SAM protein [Nanoarchaeota archaeon]